MSDNAITTRLRADGTLVRIMPDGSERPMLTPPGHMLDDAAIEAAAQSDPDALPLTSEQLARLRPVPRAKVVRRALGMTQEEFAARFHLSLATLRDWEQGRSQPDQTASTYLDVIARNPQLIMETLGTQPDHTAGK